MRMWKGSSGLLEGRGEILCDGPVDLTDETQGDVQLPFVLPPEVSHIVHCVDQQVADRLRRADGDEQAVHRRPLARCSR